LSVDSTHRKILVNFTLVNLDPPLEVAPNLYPTIQGNLLARVSFTIFTTATSPLTLSIGDVAFYDNSTQRKPISAIVAGAPITETIGAPTPPPNSTSTTYILIGIAAGVITAVAALTLLRRSRRKLPA